MLHVDAVGDEKVRHANWAYGGRDSQCSSRGESFEKGKGDDGSGSSEDGSAIDFLAHCWVSPLIVGSFSECVTQNDFGNELFEDWLLGSLGKNFDLDLVVGGEAPSESIGCEFFDESAGEIDFAAGEVFAKVGESIEFNFARKFAFVIDGEGAVGCAIASDSVEIFESESVGIEGTVTGGTRWIGAMLGESLAHSDGGDCFFRIVKYTDVGRRRGRRRAENLLHDELAALDGRGSVGVTGDGKDCAHTEKTAAVEGRYINAPETLVEVARNIVVAGETKVQECLAAIEEVCNGPAFGEIVVESVGDLGSEVIFELFGESGEELRIGDVFFESANLEPLDAEVVGESFGFGVFEHPAHLGGEGFGGIELIGTGKIEKGFIWNGSPEKETQPRCDFVAGEVARFGCLIFDAEEKVRADEDSLHCDADAVFV